MSLAATNLNQERTEVLAGKIEKTRLVDLKDGKVIFRQRIISYENMSETMQEIVGFREYMTQNENIKTFPDEHLPLIAKLVHESDKTISNLAKNLQTLLTPPTLPLSLPESRDSSAPCLSLTTLETAIKAVADRFNYGIALLNSDKSPANLCIWRWEIKNKDWLPDSMREMARQRQEERQIAKAYIQSIFDSLPEGDKERIVGKQIRTSKAQGDSTNETKTPRSNEEEPNAQAIENSDIAKSRRPKKLIDPETLAKERDKQEKKAEKEKKEKKQAEATKKSAAAFVSFFKPKASTKPSNTAFSTGDSATSSNPLTDFEVTFKPFALKKDVKLAPINWFIAQERCNNLTTSPGQAKGGSREAPIAIYDEEQTKIQNNFIFPKARGANMTHPVPKELFFDSKPLSLYTIGGTLSNRRTSKVQPPHCVKLIMHKINEAEIQGDQQEVLKLTALLKNRRKIPAKVFVFAENNRPGYLGTWTHSSSLISPRRPLVRDLISFDYDYDSDAEWAEDEAGDDVDSVDDIMDEDDASSTGSDLADWLVDSDEVQIDSVDAVVGIGTKRRAAESPPNYSKKRKVVPLVPFEKGPIWEVEIGRNAYEPFMTMRIQLFNDAPFPLDPFTFVSTSLMENACPLSKKNMTTFSVPPTSDRLSEQGLQRKMANTAPLPKTSFPDIHITLLLNKVQTSNTSSFAVLLDLIFQDMKALGIKKNALEVKLREVAEKDKEKKTWVVKESALLQHGLSIPISK